LCPPGRFQIFRASKAGLKIVERAVLRDPQPFILWVLSLSVPNTDSMGLVVLMRSRKIMEGEEDVLVSLMGVPRQVSFNLVLDHMLQQFPRSRP